MVGWRIAPLVYIVTLSIDLMTTWQVIYQDIIQKFSGVNIS